ncbi:MAG: hypothetical protein ACR2NJ_09100 [Acidimicrobiales bacterium]
MAAPPPKRFAPLLLATLAFAAGCGTAGRSGAPATTAAGQATTSTVPPTSSVPPTTAPYQASAAQRSPDLAAARLVGAWAANDLVAAASVASPEAVRALFAISYPKGDLQSRGCTEGVSPGTCTYRNTATNAIYEIGVMQSGSGWYVSSVTPEQ